MTTLVLGTNNRKKGIELAELLAPHGIAVKTLADFDRKLDVVEDGATFIENARKKAVEQARFLGQWVLGEDSGLSVDALGGAPGVHSARFATMNATENADDAANNRLLLERLGDLPFDKRTAYYTCTAALSDPTGTLHTESEGRCCGRIRFDAAGTNGFGYDPLFEVVEYHRTFGELSPAIKRCISHRARAMRRIIPLIVEMLHRTRRIS